MNNKIAKFSSGGIIYNNGKVLTIKWLSKNTIDFPKGIIEPGESSEVACVREVLEETGYKTKIIRPLGNAEFEFDDENGQRCKKTVDYFLLGLLDDSEPTPNREQHEDFKNIWLTPDEAMNQLSFDTGRDVLRRAMLSQSTTLNQFFI